MQTSNGHPLDLNDPGQRGNAAPEQSPPDVYATQMARLTAPAINAAHAAKFAAARERAAAKRFRLGVRSAGGFPCPEPTPTAPFGLASETYCGYRSGLSAGWRNGAEWSGFTAWGAAFEGGADMGRFWRIHDPRPILAAGN